MRRTVTIRTEQCKSCHAEMCDAHLAQELGIAAKCSNPRLRRFCVVCAGKKVDADVLHLAQSVLGRSVVIGIVVRDAVLREVIVRRGTRVMSVHASRGGGLVVSVEANTHGRSEPKKR